MGKFHDLKAEKQKAILLLTKRIIDPNSKKLTFEQIAKDCGVDAFTLFRWRTGDKDFQAARQELVDSYSQEMVIDAFAALHRQLLQNNNVKAAEVVLKSQGMLIDRREGVPETVVNVAVMDRDNESLAAELVQLRSKLLGVEQVQNDVIHDV